MKILVWLLSYLIALPSSAVLISADVGTSQTLSVQALDGLSALLSDTRLVLSADGFDLLYRDDPVLWARPGVIACADAAAPLDIPTVPFMEPALFSCLEETLAPWETERKEEVSLEEAGTARRQLRYTLTEEDWPQARESIAEALSLDALRDSTLSGKATFRRYFDRDGNEFGAYFYAAELNAGGSTREVRLEYGFQPTRGLYLAFRSSDGIRIVLHAKRNQSSWRLNCEVSESGARCTAQGNVPGKLTLTAATQNHGKSVQRTLTLQTEADGAQWRYAVRGAEILTGTVAWQSAALPARQAAVNGAMQEVAAAFSPRLLRALREAAPDTWQQLLFAASPESWIDAQKEEVSP